MEQSRFEAYAKLLQLKHGGQIEDASDFIEIVGEQTELSDLDNADSSNENILSHFNEDKLKRAFLDRLSEFIANQKGGRHVSSSLMLEWPDRVDVLVARNNGFSGNDPMFQLLETIASNLRDISSLNRQDPIAIDAMQNLWTSLLQSYKPRVKDYIIEVRQAFKKAKLRVSGDMAPVLYDTPPSLLLRLENFRVLVNDISRLSTQDGLEEAVQSAYDICHLYNMEDFESIIDSVSNSRTLRNALCFLGRLTTCFKTLLRGAEKLSNFQRLRILPVTILPACGARKKDSAAGNWSVAKTFSSLDLSLEDQTVKNIFGNGKKKESWTKNKLLLKFAKLKSPISEVHAEVQVILAATRHDCTGASIFEYVGCSKRSCFLCFRFIQRFGQFSTRGCHGKIYGLWTLPEVPWLAEENRLRLVKILTDIEKDMRDCLVNEKINKISHAPESTIGGSSVATTRQQFENPYVMSLVSQHLQAQFKDMSLVTTKEDNSAGSRADSASENGHDSADDHFLPEKMQNQSLGSTYTSAMVQGECRTCHQETYYQCVHCNRDWFCSQKCQNSMPLDHLAKCSARPITPADILIDDVWKDQFPKDEQIREVFGFNRCMHRREESHLLGLYKGLLLLSAQDLEFSPVKLNEWQQNGLLATKIIEKFSALPEKNRGSYFPWFLRNQYIIDNSKPSLQLDGQTNPITLALNAARIYLEPEDRDKDPRELEPLGKRYCFIFYALVLDSGIPNPNWMGLDLWYDFGFALCADEYHEGSLGALYSKLVGGNKSSRDYDQSLGVVSNDVSTSLTCSFDEFWRAWQNGSIAELFDKYGKGNSLDEISGSLRGFMSYPVEKHGLRPSVWRLKHLLALDANTPLSGFPEIEAAAQEYGFTVQLDTRTIMDLRQFYRQLLKVRDPVEVHKAKKRGELLHYTESSVKDIDSRVRDVLVEIDSRGNQSANRGTCHI